MSCRRWLSGLALLLVGLALLPMAIGTPPARGAPTPVPMAIGSRDAGSTELFRIRLVNRARGPIAVSLDAGETWEVIGRIVQPATALATVTSLYEDQGAGTVAGVDAETLAIRAPSLADEPRILTLAATGARAAPGLLVTDIPAGGPLFRSLTPPCGSQMLLQKDGQLAPLPLEYQPRIGDTLVIVALHSPACPEAIVIENKEEGEVTALTAAGQSRLIGRVRQPLRGVGRYPGTDRAGAGAVVGWQPLMVLVSTAGWRRRVGPDGNLLEGKGGFIIQPAEPMLRGATHAASQVLIESTAEPGEPRPARSPLFSLPVPISRGIPTDEAPTRVEVRIDDGPWEPMPDLRGPIGESEFRARLAAQLGEGRTVQTGITHLRIVCCKPSPALIRHALKLATTPRLGDAVQRGRVTINAKVAGEEIRAVGFCLNGDLRSLINQPPFSWVWDTTTTPNGNHLLEIRGYNEQHVLIQSVKMRVVVDN